MSRPCDLMSKSLLAKSPYMTSDARGLIKLDAMENPYSWPGSLERQWLESLSGIELNRYPDPLAKELIAILRSTQAIPENAGCLLGNGSDELIQMLIMAVRGSGRPIVAPAPSFVMYEVLARMLDVEFIPVPLATDFDLDVSLFDQVLNEKNPSILFVAHPNNPTGLCYTDTSLERLVAANPGITVIDEAYAPFTDRSWLHRVGEYPNLMVMRTLSKLGLAGLRLGYLVGTPDWIDALERLRLPYNINSLTQHSASFALQHKEIIDSQAKSILLEREQLAGELRTCAVVEHVYISEANFLLFRVRDGQADAIFQELRRQGVLIKNVSTQGKLLADCLRVTIGTPEENAFFLQILQEFTVPDCD